MYIRIESIDSNTKLYKSAINTTEAKVSQSLNGRIKHKYKEVVMAKKVSSQSTNKIDISKENERKIAILYRNKCGERANVCIDYTIDNTDPNKYSEANCKHRMCSALYERPTKDQTRQKPNTKQTNRLLFMQLFVVFCPQNQFHNTLLHSKYVGLIARPLIYLRINCITLCVTILTVIITSNK